MLKNVRIEFRDWECFLCGEVSETYKESVEHIIAEHKLVVGIMNAPQWMRTACVLLVPFTNIPLRMLGLAMFHLRVLVRVRGMEEE